MHARVSYAPVKYKEKHRIWLNFWITKMYMNTIKYPVNQLVCTSQIKFDAFDFDFSFKIISFSDHYTGFLLRVCTRIIISYSLSKQFVVGTQNNHLNETVHLSIHNKC